MHNNSTTVVLEAVLRPTPSFGNRTRIQKKTWTRKTVSLATLTLLTVSPLNFFPSLFCNHLPHYPLLPGYYDGATQLYEFGWAQSFHFSRFYKGEAFLASLARHEHYLASQMNIRPGMRVLDVGCGVGGPAREIAQFTDAQIIGLNNNEFQIQRATKYTQKAGLDNVTFVKGDFMKLAETFGENYFDAGGCSCLS
jgi:SAM-dependent methyltransferase